MNHVKPEQHREAEAGAFDSEPLQAVGLGRVGDEQECTRASCLNGGVDHRRELHHGCREGIVVRLP